MTPDQQTELRESIKQVRSNNRSLASILTSGAIDELVSIVQAHDRQRDKELLDELEADAYKEEYLHGQNALRLRVVPMASINNIRRRLKL